MRAESQLEVILAHMDGKWIDVHRDGLWCNWSGPARELVRAMQQGVLFRVKRVPRTIHAEQDGGKRLTGVCWTDEKDAIAEVGGGNTLVEFREVL